MRQRPQLSRTEISRPFDGELGNTYPVILSPTQLANLIGLSAKTIYAWIAAGRFEGCFRKRGKHILIWRDRALDQLLNGPKWTDENRTT